MAGGGQPELEAQQEKEFVCKVCGEAWPTYRALSGHNKAHGRKGKAPLVPLPLFPEAPAPLAPGPSVMPLLSSLFVAPPVMAMAPPTVAPPGLFLRGLLPPLSFAPTPVAGVGTSAWAVRPPQPQVPPELAPAGPVVSGEGEIIRMALLEANPAFWAPYRMAMDPPVEYDFMKVGLQQPRPESPSPSLSSWLNA